MSRTGSAITPDIAAGIAKDAQENFAGFDVVANLCR